MAQGIPLDLKWFQYLLGNTLNTLTRMGLEGLKLYLPRDFQDHCSLASESLHQRSELAELSIYIPDTHGDPGRAAS